jgi:hypothetical protein
MGSRLVDDCGLNVLRLGRFYFSLEKSSRVFLLCRQVIGLGLKS